MLRSPELAIGCGNGAVSGVAEGVDSRAGWDADSGVVSNAESTG
jgi:hypothetical protein